MASEIETREDDREIVSRFREWELLIGFRQNGSRVIRADMTEQTVFSKKSGK